MEDEFIAPATTMCQLGPISAGWACDPNGPIRARRGALANPA